MGLKTNGQFIGYLSTDKEGHPRKGETVDNLLNKIEDLTNVTHSKDGIMSSEDKIKLDSLEKYEEYSSDEIELLTNF